MDALQSPCWLSLLKPLKTAGPHPQLVILSAVEVYKCWKGKDEGLPWSPQSGSVMLNGVYLSVLTRLSLQPSRTKNVSKRVGRDWSQILQMKIYF